MVGLDPNAILLNVCWVRLVFNVDILTYAYLLYTFTPHITNMHKTHQTFWKMLLIQQQKDKQQYCRTTLQINDFK